MIDSLRRGPMTWEAVEAGEVGGGREPPLLEAAEGRRSSSSLSPGAPDTMRPSAKRTT